MVAMAPIQTQVRSRFTARKPGFFHISGGVAARAYWSVNGFPTSTDTTMMASRAALPNGWIQRLTQASPATHPMMPSATKATALPTSSTMSGRRRTISYTFDSTARPNATETATANEAAPDRIQ